VKSCRDQLATPAPARLHQKCAELAERERTAAAAGTERFRKNPSYAKAAPAARSWQPPFWRRWVPLSLVATVVLVVAGVFGYSLLSSRGTALAAQLAGDHIRCIGLVGDRAPADPSVARTRLAAATGMGGSNVPLFQTGDDLQFVQLRRCLHGQGVDMAHISTAARPAAVLVRDAGARARSAGARGQGQRTVIWSQGGRTTRSSEPTRRPSSRSWPIASAGRAAVTAARLQEYGT